MPGLQRLVLNLLIFIGIAYVQREVRFPTQMAITGRAESIQNKNPKSKTPYNKKEP